MDETQLEYVVKDLDAKEVQEEIRSFFAEAASDPGAKRDANDAELDLDAILADGPDQIQAKPGEAGFGGVGEVIVIVLAKKGLETFWDKVIVPWMERQNDKPLGEKIVRES
jgi:hypothetical protein